MPLVLKERNLFHTPVDNWVCCWKAFPSFPSTQGRPFMRFSALGSSILISAIAEDLKSPVPPLSLLWLFDVT